MSCVGVKPSCARIALAFSFISSGTLAATIASFFVDMTASIFVKPFYKYNMDTMERAEDIGQKKRPFCLVTLISQQKHPNSSPLRTQRYNNQLCNLRTILKEVA